MQEAAVSKVWGAESRPAFRFAIVFRNGSTHLLYSNVLILITVGRMCPPAESDALLPCLPSEVAQKILQHLSMRDICNAAQAFKSLWCLTCQLSSLKLETHLESAASISSTIESFLAFVRRRYIEGMKVTSSYSSLQRSPSVTFSCLYWKMYAHTLFCERVSKWLTAMVCCRLITLQYTSLQCVSMYYHWIQKCFS